MEWAQQQNRDKKKVSELHRLIEAIQSERQTENRFFKKLTVSQRTMDNNKGLTFKLPKFQNGEKKEC